LAIAFDGDGDRIGVVDETGRIIWGDELMILLSREILKEKPGATIIAEVKCSQNLFNDIAKNGGTPLMWKAGHSLIKAKMKETGAALAGRNERSYLFRRPLLRFRRRDLRGRAVLEILSKTDKTLSQLLADVPQTFYTPELRVDCADERKFDIVAKIAEEFSRTNEVITIDGARILFPNGWGLVRASNTQEILVLRFEADSETNLKAIWEIVGARVNRLIENVG
jgi:phosphomannomutase/phosphoglucomutase